MKEEKYVFSSFMIILYFIFTVYKTNIPYNHFYPSIKKNRILKKKEKYNGNFN